jgi:hypothetical protein
MPFYRRPGPSPPQQVYQTLTQEPLQAFAQWVPQVPLKPLASPPSYQPKPTPYNIAYRLNDCIGCFQGHDADFWKVYHALLSKACYSEDTDYWELTCGQQQDAMLVYDGMKLCLENG